MDKTNKIPVLAKAALGSLAGLLGFASDVITPLLPLSQYIFIAGGILVVMSSPFIYGRRLEGFIFKTYFFIVILTGLSGVMWGGQTVYELNKGTLASFFPSIVKIQNGLGIEDRVKRIDENIEVMGGDVKNIKEEVTKTLNVDELIVDLHKCSTQAEKEKIIIIIKKYDFKELISGKQLLSILGHFSGKKRVDLSIELSKYLRPDLSSAQFFQIITPDMDMQEFGYVFPPFSIKMGEPLKFIDYIEHINKVAKGGMNRTYQATVLAGNLEHINGNQKAQIADLLGVEVSMVDGYL